MSVNACLIRFALTKKIKFVKKKSDLTYFKNVVRGNLIVVNFKNLLNHT